MSPAISVNKGRCKHQALSSCSHPDCSPWGDSGWRKTGYWPWTAVVNIKGVISMSSDSWIFLYKEKHQNYSLEMSVFVISSNRSKFNYFFFSPAKTPIHPVPPWLLWSRPSEQSERMSSSPSNKTQFLTLRLYFFFFYSWHTQVIIL